MKFHDKALKLTGLYLAIIVFISVFFSVNVYQQSTYELDRGIREPEMIFQGQGGEAGLSVSGQNGKPKYTIQPQTRKALHREIVGRTEEAKENVRNRLILTNLVILVAAGFISYYLASRTLRPIEEAHEAQSRFTADASHELRTPIAAMQSEIEVALMDPKLKLADAKQILQSNLEELGKLTALSSGLLKLAQNEYGSLEMVDVDLAEAITQANDRVATKAKDKNITVNTMLPDKVLIRADATSVVDLFVTIIDNSIKYSSENSTVEITTEVQRKKAIIHIKDQGIGMLATDTQHIFDRFYRADSARSKQHSNGYGIGLSIAKQIVDVHHGTITVQSEPDKGSTFSISLPLAS